MSAQQLLNPEKGRGGKSSSTYVYGLQSHVNVYACMRSRNIGSFQPGLIR